MLREITPLLRIWVRSHALMRSAMVFSTDPLPYETSAGTSAVGGAPSNTMYMLNTKYLHWRPHARRNMVPLDPERFSVNQDAMVKLIGWAGNMTLSNAFLQGILSA